MDFESPEQKQEREEAEREYRRELDDLRFILSTKQGRRFVWNILQLSGVTRQSFAGESTHETAFREGNRVHGLKLFAAIHLACPERYAEMGKEAEKPQSNAEMA